MANGTILEMTHLSKRFGQLHAVEDVSLKVKQGEIYGFLGPNGAGKTTTISMILSLISPTTGTIELFGEPVTLRHNRALQRVGTLISSPALIQPFSAHQNLRVLANMRPDLPVQRIQEVLAMVGLKNVNNRSVSKYSQGMRQRLGLAQAILNQPDLLILDEPTNGLDANGMYEIRILLKSLAERGVTIFLSSHLLYEMQQLCDSIAVIQRGRIIAEGMVKDLLNKQKSILITTATPQASANALLSLPDVKIILITESTLELTGISSEKALAYLEALNLLPIDIIATHPDLETLFLELTAQNAIA